MGWDNDQEEHDMEEQFFGDERKRFKQERKELKAKDRSKYKKTDKDKWLTQLKSKQAQRGSEEGLIKGRVLSITPQEVTVDVDGKEYICGLRGLLKKDFSHEKNLLAVGDFVLFKPLSEKEGTIITVEERYSLLARSDNLSRRKQQLIAANIDQVLITLSVVLPPLKPFIIDRYIIATEKGGMKPVIVINKIDLLNGDAPEAEIEREVMEEIIRGYSHVGIPVIKVSTVTGEGLDDLKKVMQDKASVFSGQSGVGKSSLINAVTGLELKIGETVDKTRKGSHTTTTTQLIPLTFGGFCIDTPGIKSFGVWDLDRSEIESYFDEIHTLGLNCKYPDCRHYLENDCAVKEAVEKGTLSSLRYQSYLNLLSNIDEEHLRR